MFALVLALSATTALADDCVVTYRIADIETALSDAEAAYVARNKDSVHTNVALAVDRLRCVTDEVNTVTAARIHRAVGLDGFLSRDDVREKTAFEAALLLDPGYTFPITMAPEGSAIRADYDAAKAFQAPPGTALNIPANLKVHIDGAPAVDRPAGRPAVIQAFDPAGVALTGWYKPDDPLTLPAARAAPIALGNVAPVETARVSRPHGLNRPLAYTAAGALVAGGALYGAAWVTNGAYTSAADGDKGTIVTENHVFTISGFSLAGAGAITGALAVATGSW